MIFAIIPTTITGAVAWWVSKETLKEKLTSEFQDRLSLVEGRIVGALIDMQRNAETWANSAVMLDIRNQDAKRRIANFILGTANSYHLVTHITIFDRRKKIIATTNMEYKSFKEALPGGKKNLVHPGVANYPIVNERLNR